ncbi:MAG: AAA family ATPase [Gemmatimonadetes bacterium]|nr:AAA family ATPase [Gemmatimonadota bacterium]
MEALRLLTLGRARLEGTSRVLLPTARRRELALLAYIARRAPRPISREELATLFWGEREETRARHSLRQLLFLLRRTVGGCLRVTGETVWLEDDAIELDVVAFEADLAAGRREEGIARYGGQFLPGAENLGGEGFRGWLESERAGLERRYVSALSEWADEAAASSDWACVERCAERWAACRPLDEAPLVYLVEALEKQGRFADAAARRAAFTARLRDELGEEPLSPIVRDAPRAADRSERRPASAALLTPDMIGRTAVLATLKELWRDIATEGAGALIEGDPGIGKTRLLREFVQETDGNGGRLLLQVRGERDNTSWSAARMLFAPVRFAPGLAGVSDSALARLSTLVPTLRDRFQHLPAASAGKNELLDAASETLEIIGQETPVLVVADDFPLLDEGTRGLLLGLLGRPRPNVFVVLAASTDDLRGLGRLPEIESSAGAARIRLQPLDLDEVGAMVASMVELASEAQLRDLARRIHKESGGVPFYCVELVSMLADSGVLAIDRAGWWTVTRDMESVPLPLPANVEEAIRRRLGLLGREAADALEAAAVIGPRADAAVLEHIVDLPADILSTAISELIARRILRWIPDLRPGYEFTHELIRRAAVERIPAGRRHRLHRRAARVFAARSVNAPELAAAAAFHRESARELAPRRHLRGRMLAASLLAALSIGAGTLALRRDGAVAHARERSRVVVLPFEHTGGPGLLDRIAADWISQAIARTALVRVAPPPVEYALASDTIRSRTAALRAARTAKADIAVRGAIYESGDSARITSEVLDVRSGEVLGVAGPVTAAIADPMRAIDALRERTLALLSPWVDSRMASSAAVQSNPPSYAAYRAFAQGLDHFYARRGDRALPHFLEAYALDTTYTLPLLYAVLVHEGHNNRDGARELLRILTPRRGELAPYDRTILDYESAMVRADWRAMYTAASQGADIAPGSLLAVYQRPRAAMALNRPRHAVDLLSQIDPNGEAALGLPGYWNLLAHAMHMAGDYKGQLRVGREVLRRLPHEHRAFSYQARALAALGRLRELDAVLEESWLLPSIPEFGPPGFLIHDAAAQELAAHGHPDHARRVLERALRMHEASPSRLLRIRRHAFGIARILYFLDRFDEAEPMFEVLVTETEPDAWGYLAFIAASTGDEKRAAMIDARLRDASAFGPYIFGMNTEYRARIAALQGRHDDAVRLLRQAVAEGREYDSGTHVLWEFAPLRGYPLFEEWLRPKE